MVYAYFFQIRMNAVAFRRLVVVLQIVDASTPRGVFNVYVEMEKRSKQNVKQNTKRSMMRYLIKKRETLLVKNAIIKNEKENTIIENLIYNY